MSVSPLSGSAQTSSEATLGMRPAHVNRTQSQTLPVKVALAQDGGRNGDPQLLPVDRSGAQSPAGGLPADRCLHAASVRMQVSAAPGPGLVAIHYDQWALPDQADQVTFGRPLPAADARTDRLAHLPHERRATQLASTSGAAVSDRMSIRQPVSRAARRAFWPSRPMASESW